MTSGPDLDSEASRDDTDAVCAVSGSLFEGLDAVGCAEALVVSQRTVRRGQAEQLVLVGHWADVNHPDRVPDSGSGSVVKRSRRQRVQLGGEGTPVTSAFAHDELACLLGCSTYVAGRKLAAVLNLRHRHPHLWAATLGLEVESWLACKIATLAAAAGLSWEQCLTLDAQTTAAVVGLPTGRALQTVEAAIQRADPEVHAEKLKHGRTQHGVWLGRRGEDPDGTGAGTRTLFARGATLEVARLWAILTHLAQLLAAHGDTDTVDQRRAKALALLANPAAACVLLAGTNPFPAPNQEPTSEPTAESAPESAAESAPESTAEPTEDSEPEPEQDPEPDPEPEPEPEEDSAPSVVELAAALGRTIIALGPKALTKLRPRSVFYYHHAPGSVVIRPGDPTLGPLATSEVIEALRSEHVSVKPVINLSDHPAADAYETPPAIVEALHLIHPFDVFPYSTTRAASCDTDHTIAYIPIAEGGPPGQTRIGNLGPANRHHHLAKTHGGFTLHQPLPGVFYWHTPTGHWLAPSSRGTPHGTRHLGRETPDLLTLTTPTPHIDFSPGENAILEGHLLKPDPPA